MLHDGSVGRGHGEDAEGSVPGSGEDLHRAGEVEDLHVVVDRDGDVPTRPRSRSVGPRRQAAGERQGKEAPSVPRRFVA